MKYETQHLEGEEVLAIARAAAAAARTAPKARGIDDILTLVLTGAEKDRLADEVLRIGEEKGIGIFVRDSKNLRGAGAVLLVGVRNKVREVPNCGYCGYPDCTANARAGGVCAMCVTDLGIAVGSAASVAADRRADTRVMFTIGKAALGMGLLPDAAAAFALPFTIAGKNPFFDRK